MGITERYYGAKNALIKIDQIDKAKFYKDLKVI